jgi:hypothetical protein
VSLNVFQCNKQRKKLFLNSLVNSDEIAQKQFEKLSKQALILLLNEKDERLHEKDERLNEKDEIIREKDERLTEKVNYMNLQLSIINTKYYKVMGNLSIRGLIEQMESSANFKKIKTKLRTFTGEGVSKRAIEAPREVVWDQVMAVHENDYAELINCVNDKNSSGRRESLGKQVRDLYQDVSKSIHKPDEGDDAVIIRTGALFEHQVIKALLFIIILLFLPIVQQSQLLSFV